MLQELERLRDEIRLEMINNQDYAHSIQLLEKFSQNLNFSNDIDFDWWFVNYNTSLSYKKLGEIQTAIKYAEKSMEHYKTDSCFHQSLWLLGSCYEQQKNYKNAVEIYRICCSFYKRIEAHDFRFCTMFNMARLLDQFNTMKLIIKIYQNGDYINSVDTYGDMTKETNLRNMYKELFELYIGNSDLKSAINLVHTVNNVELKKELTQLLRNKMLIAS